MKLLIVKRADARIPRKFLTKFMKSLGREVAKYVDVRKELVVVFVENREMQKLNKTYRKKNRPTDILSFESVDPEVVGELVIAPAVIAKQAREHGLSFEAELAYMIIHGVLHLAGYDHEHSAREAKKMFAIQDKIFEKLVR